MIFIVSERISAGLFEGIRIKILSLVQDKGQIFSSVVLHRKTISISSNEICNGALQQSFH